MRWMVGWLCLWCALEPRSWALEPLEYTLLLSAQAQLSPPQINIRWPVNIESRQIVIRKKTREAASWGNPIATLAGDATQFIDSNVVAGQAYEYEFTARLGDQPDPPTAYGYVCAGAGVILPEFRGKVLLVVDSTHASALAAELDLLKRNLVGEGWAVARRDVGRSDPVTQVRGLIQAEYNADPANMRAVFLIGHVPVPYSGLIYPDLHWSHRGAWPADVFYGEMNGAWTDTTVSHINSDQEENSNLPGDGKFDQSTIPTEVELEVGRVDFWGLPAFAPRSELELLRNYLNKNHRFRHRETPLPNRGLLRDEFGEIAGDAPAVDGWRAFPAFFGLTGFYAVNANQYFPTLRTEGYLFSYAGGGGDYRRANGVGSTSDFAANDPRCAFYLLHGSYFGDWNNEDNFLRAAIATPTYSLVSIWSSLPHWFFHRMAVGETIGSAVKLVQNNRNGIYRTDWDWAVGEVHISMMGAPTLRLQMVAPPRNLRATSGGSALILQWDAPAEPVGGYNIYRADSMDGQFVRLNRRLVTETRFDAPLPPQGRSIYMARAQALQTTGSGSFQNMSQGAFLELTQNLPQLAEITVRAASATAVEGGAPLTFEFTRARNLDGAVAVNYQLSGTAATGEDYPPQAGTITFASGAASAVLALNPLADNVAEFDETVFVTIVANSNYTIGSASSASGVIRMNGECRIRNARLAATTFSFDVNGYASRAYRVQSRPPGGTWRDRRTGVASADGSAAYSETLSPSSGSELYRVVWE